MGLDTFTMMTGRATGRVTGRATGRATGRVTGRATGRAGGSLECCYCKCCNCCLCEHIPHWDRADIERVLVDHAGGW